jgi:hypothetical protein
MILAAIGSVVWCPVLGLGYYSCGVILEGIVWNFADRAKFTVWCGMTYLSWNKSAGNLRTWPSHLLGCVGREGTGESTSLWALMMPCRLGCGPHLMFSGTDKPWALWTWTNNSANGTMIILPPSQKLCLAGHFPMSFTTSTETGKHPDGIFAKHNISAYVCTQNWGSIFISITVHLVI